MISGPALLEPLGMEVFLPGLPLPDLPLPGLSLPDLIQKSKNFTTTQCRKIISSPKMTAASATTIVMPSMSQECGSS